MDAQAAQAARDEIAETGEAPGPGEPVLIRPRARVTYAFEVAPAAVRQLRKLDPPARRRVQAAIELLAENPRPPKAGKLVGGAGEWRVRTGDYRIVYEIHDGRLVVLWSRWVTGETLTTAALEAR